VNRVFRVLSLVFGLAVGYFLRLPWATVGWPWEDGRLSYIFISSIMAAIAAPILWIGLSGESGAAAGGAINLGVTFAGASVFLFQLYAGSGEGHLLRFAVACAIIALLNVAILIWSLRQPIRDTRPMPLPVKISFGVFAVVLTAVALALILQAPTIFPWPLDPRSSVLFGWIFMGAMTYFVYAILRPSWHNTKGQLLGFLAYDLVLIVPYVRHFANVKPEHLLSLVIYLTVIVYSGLLAVYYLVVNPSTRGRTAPSAAPAGR
jgi:hypothetical protein